MEGKIPEEIKKKWSLTHTIEIVDGTKTELKDLGDNQCVIWGDGSTFHYRMTEKSHTELSGQLKKSIEFTGQLVKDKIELKEVNSQLSEACIKAISDIQDEGGTNTPTWKLLQNAISNHKKLEDESNNPT